MDRNFRDKRFEAYGLDKEKNWLTTPDKKIIIEGNREKRYEFMKNKLKETRISSSALFAHALDGSLCSAVRIVEDGKERFFINEQDEYKNIYAFRDVAKYFRIEKYALLIQEGVKEWTIVHR